MQMGYERSINNAFDEAENVVLAVLAAGTPKTEIKVFRIKLPENNNVAYNKFPLWNIVVGDHVEQIYWVRT